MRRASGAPLFIANRDLLLVISSFFASSLRRSARESRDRIAGRSRSRQAKSSPPPCVLHHRREENERRNENEGKAGRWKLLCRRPQAADAITLVSNLKSSVLNLPAAAASRVQEQAVPMSLRVCVVLHVLCRTAVVLHAYTVTVTGQQEQANDLIFRFSTCISFFNFQF
uniref:Uncharacterized protein n=1 Tax=Oryza sativa subsp. japonica TaxID=39947 RepID=Q6Z5E6_ORYSJ|nr:hypothetical protein [Oryza sativa Japonica Group]